MEPSVYERGEWERIRAWKRERHAPVGRARQIMSLPIEKAASFLSRVPGVTWAVDRSVGPLVGALNGFAQSSVRPAAIHGAYRNRGHAHVQGHGDVSSLDLEDIDRTIGLLAAKYKAMALAEGAATGLAGAGGIPVDVVALVLLNLRAIGEYATYCGFDIAGQQERLFAMNVLGFASGPTPRQKLQALAQLARVARDLSSRKPWKELRKHTLIRIIKQLAKSLGIRLTKAKLAQLIPAAGALVGGVFNARFTSSVCEAASMLYRERFLTEKYGAALAETPPIALLPARA